VKKPSERPRGRSIRRSPRRLSPAGVPLDLGIESRSRGLSEPKRKTHSHPTSFDLPPGRPAPLRDPSSSTTTRSCASPTLQGRINSRRRLRSEGARLPPSRFNFRKGEAPAEPLLSLSSRTKRPLANPPTPIPGPPNPRTQSASVSRPNLPPIAAKPSDQDSFGQDSASRTERTNSAPSLPGTHPDPQVTFTSAPELDQGRLPKTSTSDHAPCTVHETLTIATEIPEKHTKLGLGSAWGLPPDSGIGGVVRRPEPPARRGTFIFLGPGRGRAGRQGPPRPLQTDPRTTLFEGAPSPDLPPPRPLQADPTDEPPGPMQNPNVHPSPGVAPDSGAIETCPPGPAPSAARPPGPSLPAPVGAKPLARGRPRPLVPSPRDPLPPESRATPPLSRPHDRGDGTGRQPAVSSRVNSK